jgi:hypothetical protein
MHELHRFRKKENQPVVAVPLDLETDGFNYKKWGREQRCKQGDWVINNNGDIYTIDADVFAHTYRNIGIGIYIKTSKIWACLADKPGTIKTKEGSSDYKKGDYIVYNSPDCTDGYCMSAEKFESMYLSDD